MIRELTLPGQRRVHFAKESDARRKQVLDVVDLVAPDVVIYDSSLCARRRQREACLEHVVRDLAKSGASLLVIESDESVVALGRRLLFRYVRQLDCDTLEYRHLRAREEPLLAVPDALAWCWHRGGHWRKRVASLVSDVQQITE